MRAWLNNPRIVIPMAVFALLFLLIQYGLLDSFLEKIKRWPSHPVQLTPMSTSEQEATEDPFADYAPSVWQPRNLNRYQSLKRSLFFVGYEKPVEEFELPELPELSNSEKVIVDQEQFEFCLVQRVGLDHLGYFVVFENVLNEPVRKRAGDFIFIKDGPKMTLPLLGIAERNRTHEEHRLAALESISGLKLKGVGAESGGREVGAFKGLAEIEGGDGDDSVYLQGEIVKRDPNLGLSEICETESEKSVILVDRYANRYRLTLVE